MLFERIESEGLAHYSYLIGDKNEAVVVDPRRDCEIYIEMASQREMRIVHILETHRNEDYVVGSVELSSRTDAQIWHADSQLKYGYGQAVKEGQTWTMGQFQIEAISTPGHTPGSMSYLLRDVGGDPWMVFTGDALFAGEVGRVDLVSPDRTVEMAHLLYDSLFNKLLPLGDEVIVCPGHGAGSVCGASIADRKWTTIGLERKLNSKLQFSNEVEFVNEIALELERPPHFRQIEMLNLKGASLLCQIPHPTPLSADKFAAAANDGFVLDTRTELGFGAAHLPYALNIWQDGVSSYGGWFLPYDKQILLVNETGNKEQVTRYLLRLGYDNVTGYLAGGMLAWHMAGKESKSIRAITVQELCCILDQKDKGEAWLLDVRGIDELERNGRISSAHHIHITLLPERLNEVPKDRTIYIFCGSGLRSMIAASILQKEGWENLKAVLGGLAGWSSATCPIVRK